MDASLGDGSYFLPDSSLLGAHDVFSPYPELLATPESKNPSVESMGNPLHPQSQYLSQDNNSTEGIHSTQNTEADSDFRAKSNLSMPVASHNTRAGLPRRRSRYFIRRSMPTSKPVFIPNQADEALDPMQRWQESPPEDEPASMSAIMNAINTSDKEGIKPRTRNSFRRYRGSNSRASSNSGTSISSHQSAASTRSTASAATPDPLVAQTKSHSRVNKGKRRRPADNNDQSRVFCCTFCCDKFKNRYDWVRHEKSLHLNLEEWSCAPHGGSPLSPLTNRRHCAYCHCLEPSAQHLEDHNFYPCSTGDRTFRRKDHLVQHLRLVHHLDAMPLIDDWKTTASVVTSRCGFCDQRLASWDDRIEHLAVHYRAGMKMNDWRGDHEFEPSIAARVTNAVPPYLLGSESVSLVPFSATDLTTKDHFAQISSRAHWANKGTGQQTPHQAERNAEELGLTTSFEQLQTHDTPLKTFMEVITLHLSRYARQQMSEGVIPTDEMFQREARQVMYGSEDSWEQTFADHPEWISTFRQKHCRTDDPTLAGLADSPDSSKAIQPE
ncbi:hypothetical protein N7492_006806 [Penicillium capsulatum]|uniref:C2H2-type domain-containing protein n=1 Tax=Penicillium capsulatum TaxID=69766 RepID=A0A9W9HYL7_9EURO|nr:hypothetical protein N7492_006806 [Penicillium capsulatum]KAJ6116641.1 hypothetical protein N7512_006366 [Penicillium capsulatum]